MKLQFILCDYGDGTHSGTIRSDPVVTKVTLKSESAARGKAGRLAKKNGGPVDLAWAGDEPWNERYISTAIPSRFHASGYQFERID